MASKDRDDASVAFDMNDLLKRLSTIGSGLFAFDSIRLLDLYVRKSAAYWEEVPQEAYPVGPFESPVAFHGTMVVLCALAVLIMWASDIQAYYALPDDPPVERDEW